MDSVTSDVVQSELVKQTISKCNDINKSDKGIGTEDDNIDDYKHITYHKVDPKFKLLDVEVNFYLVHMKLVEDGKTLVVIPGFSEESICWTIGRINRYKDIILENGFSNVYIFDLKEIKQIEKDKNVYGQGQAFTNEFYTSIARIVDKIIRALILKGNNISILGRSAGGGVSIWMYHLHTCTYIEGLNLAAPGYDPIGLQDMFLVKAKENNLKVRLSYSPRDTKVPGIQIDKMKDQLSSLEDFDFIKVTDTGSDKPSINHRIHKQALDQLV